MPPIPPTLPGAPASAATRMSSASLFLIRKPCWIWLSNGSSGRPRPAEEPGFRLCLISLLYLLYVDTAALGPPISPLELPGATTFFQKRGPHALPSAPLEERFGRDLAGFFQVGARLGAAKLASGDGALAFQVFPKLPVEVILWEADEEFPAQVSFTVPSHLDRFWQLDAVLGLLGLVVKEMLRAAGPVTS